MKGLGTPEAVAVRSFPSLKLLMRNKFTASLGSAFSLRHSPPSEKAGGAHDRLLLPPV